MNLLILSILILIEWTNCFYLESSANYMKPQMERNNIVNKKIWVRHKANQDGSAENNDATHMEVNNAPGSFIFRTDSMDAGFLQNAFDRFGENTLQDIPMVTGYVQRERRSPEYVRKRQTNLKAKKILSRKIEDAMIKSKIVSDLKPATVFNEYPYAVALLLSNAERSAYKLKQKKSVLYEKINTNATVDKLKVLPINSTTNSSRRSKKYDDLKALFPKYNLEDESNETEDSNALTRSVYDKETIWNENNAPISDNNMYKVVTNPPDEKPKGVSERGLIKVIAMLTRSFKRIMKHYKEIIAVHNHILKITQEFDVKASEIFMKFEDFDSKYGDMVHYSNKIKEISTKMDSAQEYLQTKFKNIEESFTEFQNQQKTFLGQQKQFSRLQRLMAAQNDKINQKQNQIAKTQSEISLRQNNFARILKKAKQVLLDNQINNTTFKPSNYQKTINNKTPEPTSPEPYQSMKINLFSIPLKNKLKNQDDLIIKEKDDKQIDDLVYKYYFNNTFIDNLMKSKILNNYASQRHSIELVRQAKNKRNELKTTVMLPKQKNNTAVRTKRWVNSFGRKYRRIHHANKASKTTPDPSINNVEGTEKKVDPYIVMATSFCKEIGKKHNDQSLKWCVEKSLRKLKMMDMMTYTPPSVTVMSEKPQPQSDYKYTTYGQTTHGITTLSAVPSNPSTVLYTQDTPTVTQALPYSTSLHPVTSVQDIYFPDNDELESNLKQYEIKPDTEGNVYYDGSVHISDFGRMLSTPKDSEGTSDEMPGFVDSNSNVDIDPLAFEIQAQRRAYVNRINEELLKKMRITL